MLCIKCFDIFRVFQYAWKCRFSFNWVPLTISWIYFTFWKSPLATIKGKHHNEIHKSLLTTDEFIYMFVFNKTHSMFKKNNINASAGNTKFIKQFIDQKNSILLSIIIIVISNNNIVYIVMIFTINIIIVMIMIMIKGTGFADLGWGIIVLPFPYLHSMQPIMMIIIIIIIMIIMTLITMIMLLWHQMHLLQKKLPYLKGAFSGQNPFEEILNQDWMRYRS